MTQEQYNDFIARGGKVQQIEEGERALTPQEMRRKQRGEDYTDARMRSAENEENVRRPYYGL